MDWEYYYGKADYAQNQLKNYDEAVLNYKIAIEMNPQSERLYLALGNLYNETGNYDMAIAILLQALRSNLNSSTLNQGIGASYFSMQDYESALSYFEKGLAMDPSSSLLNYSVGECLMKHRKPTEALKYYLAALKYGHCSSNFYANLGFCYLKLSLIDYAEKYYLKAIESGPQSGAGYNGLGYCAAHKGAYDDAIHQFEISIAVQPDSIIPYFNIGQCYQLKKQYTSAKSYFERAMQKNGFKGDLFIALYNLPQQVFAEDEPSGFIYFLKAIQLNVNRIGVVSFERLLEITLENEALMLFYHLLGNIYFDVPEVITKRPDYTEVARLSKPFRQQFALWEINRKDTAQSLLAEALMNFYLGNPIRAYQIFSKRKAGGTNGMSLMENYYFLLSARAIAKDEEAYFEQEIMRGVYWVITDGGITTTDQYYAALLMELAGRTSDAIAQLENLVTKGYTAANYALAQFKRKLFANQATYEAEVLTRFLDWHLGQENYFRTPTVISLDEDEESIVANLLPLIQLMESRIVLENLVALRNNHYENMFEQRFLFSRYIEFVHLKDLVEGNALEKSNPIIYERIYGSDEERERIEPEIAVFKIFEKDNKGILNMVTQLHKGAFTDFIYIRENLSLPPQKTNYRHFMALVITLHEQKLINDASLFSLQLYITYCAETVYSVSGKNEAMGYAISCLKEQLITFSLFGLSFDTLETIYSLAYNKINGVQSELLSYEEFMKSRPA